MQYFLSVRRIGLIALLATLLALIGCTRCASCSIDSADATLIKELAFHLDQGGHASLQAMQSENDWHPFTGWKSFGFGTSPIWFRLHLKSAEMGAQSPWVVQIAPPFLEQLTLYDPQTGEVQHLGAGVSAAGDAFGSINFAFKIAALAQEREVYLRLESTSTRTLHIDVLTYEAAQHEAHLLEWLYAFMGSLSIILAIWAVVHWWQSRDGVMGTFALKQITCVAWAFLYFGFARIMVGGGLPDGALSVFFALANPLAIGASTWFLSRLIGTYQPSKKWLRVCFTLAYFMLLLPLLQALGYTIEMRALCNIFIPLNAITLAITLLTARRSNNSQPISRSYLLAYLCVYGTLAILPGAVYLGLLAANPVLLIGAVSCTFFDGMIMFMILQIRAASLRETHLQATLEARRSQEQALLERHQKEEQGKLLAMLAHEMKTPLATMRMRMSSGHFKKSTLESAVSHMNQVIERCVYSAQIADQGLQPVCRPLNIRELSNACIQACQSPECIDFEATGVVPLVHGDNQMISIVFSNLLDNACKYRAPQSQVTVTLKAFEGSDARAGILWRVSNAIGHAGVPDPRQLYEKYYRSPQARRQSGSGLGLFLVKGLIDLMQGTIQHEAHGERIDFSIWLPLSTEAV